MSPEIAEVVDCSFYLEYFFLAEACMLCFTGLGILGAVTPVGGVFLLQVGSFYFWPCTKNKSLNLRGSCKISILFCLLSLRFLFENIRGKRNLRTICINCI